MGKPRKNKRRSSREIEEDKARNERRKQAIAQRTAGQFNDVPPGQRQKLLKSNRPARLR